jgi:hypothetical protein
MRIRGNADSSKKDLLPDTGIPMNTHSRRILIDKTNGLRFT